MELNRIESINKREAFRYMGFKNNKSPDKHFLALTDECEKMVLDSAKPKLIYKIFDITSSCDDKETLKDTKLVLVGKNITELLKESERCCVFAATLGVTVDALIRRLEISDITLGFIADNLASALIEQVCDNAQDTIKKSLDNALTTPRFSCGYGDLPLSLQVDFLSALDAQNKIGLTVTDTMIMTPRKSVTAVFGIR